MKLFVSIITLSLSILLYNKIFVEQVDSKVSYQLEALKQVYRILGMDHNITLKQMNNNAIQCQSQDHYKLTHPDIVLRDVYCNHKYQDTMGKMYNTACFSIGHHTAKEYEMASQVPYELYRKKQTISRYVVKSENRQSFMASRCVFTINLNMYPGLIAKKSFIHNKQVAYENKMIKSNATKQCLQDLRFAPVTFALSNTQECQEIFKLLQVKFSQNMDIPSYIVKTNVHQGYGLYHIDNLLYSELSDLYRSGSLCGKIEDTNIIQELTQKPTLLRGHKMDIRIWVLIVQAEPLIMYVYDYTVIMACLEAYNIKNITQYNFNCNAGLAKDYWTNNRSGAINPFTLGEVHSGSTFKQWGEYFKKQGLVKSDSWWQLHLLPLFEKKITYFMKIMLKNLRSDQRLSAIYALDAALDLDLNLKIFDFNPNPELHSLTTGMTFVQNMLHVDTFKLLKLYLIQRYQKLIKFIDDVMIPNIKIKKLTYQHQIKQVLQIQPILQRKIFQFYLIDQVKAVRHCKPFDEEL